MPNAPYRSPSESPKEPGKTPAPTALGRQVAEFRRPPLRAVLRRLPFIVALVVVGAVISPARTQLDARGWIVFSLIAGGAVLIAILVGSGALSRRHTVRVFDLGLVVSARSGDRLVLWEDVDAFFVDYETQALTNRPVAVQYTLTTHSGERLSFGRGLQNAGQLDGLLTNYVSRPLLPEARSALAEGGMLQFGAVSITKDALHVEGESLPWADIEALRTTHSVVRVHKRGATFAWKSLALREIAHPWVFFALSARADDREAARRVIASPTDRAGTRNESRAMSPAPGRRLRFPW